MPPTAKLRARAALSRACRDGRCGRFAFPIRLGLILLLFVSGGTIRAGDDKPAGGESRDLIRRIAGRSFPSVFQAWSPADNLPGEDSLSAMARHDLVFHSPEAFALRWDRQPHGLASGFTAESVRQGLETRRKLLAKNPNMVLLAEIRYRDASRNYLPENHEWWKRDKAGRPVPGWSEGRFLQLDFANPAFRAHVAAQAAAAVRCGVVDGVMLDWWRDDDDRLALIQAVRKAVGDEAMILCNANDEKTPRTAPYLNGYFMECWRTRKAEDWRRIADTLAWAEKNLRTPRINCLETWYHASRDDLNLMRATTTLALTHSDGYCLFSDPNDLPTADHRHNWYPFWDKKLGKPSGKGEKRPDGSFARRFEHGDAVYNPLGNPAVTVTLDEPRTSAATGKTDRRHVVNPCDGDLFLRPDE